MRSKETPLSRPLGFVHPETQREDASFEDEQPFKGNSLSDNTIAKSILPMITTQYIANTTTNGRPIQLQQTNLSMPRVLQIDDEKWTQTFRYDCDSLNFRFYEQYAADKARKYGKIASDYVTDNTPKHPHRPHWGPSCAFPYAAALSSASNRIKQSSATTVMEVIDFFNYVLEAIAQDSKLTADDRKGLIRPFLEESTDSIGKLVYYYTTAFVTPSLLKAKSWEEAEKLHGIEVHKLATDHFYLVRCFAADLIAKTLLNTCSSPGLLQRAIISYDPVSDHLISHRERANLRKRIARRIGRFPEEKLAYEAAFFTVDNCASDTLKTLYSPAFHPSRTLFGPKRSCQNFSVLPFDLIR
ncbi:hypothetical protein ACR42D_04850 [Desulfovibrio caledoniensis]